MYRTEVDVVLIVRIVMSIVTFLIVLATLIVLTALDFRPMRAVLIILTVLVVSNVLTIPTILPVLIILERWYSLVRRVCSIGGVGIVGSALCHGAGGP
jgi:hypothetical protein